MIKDVGMSREHSIKWKKYSAIHFKMSKSTCYNNAMHNGILVRLKGKTKAGNVLLTHFFVKIWNMVAWKVHVKMFWQ